jgi:hypothetical protein
MVAGAAAKAARAIYLGLTAAKAMARPVAAEPAACSVASGWRVVRAPRRFFPGVLGPCLVRADLRPLTNSTGTRKTDIINRAVADCQDGRFARQQPSVA